MSEMFLSVVQGSGWCDGTIAKDNGILTVHQAKYFY